MEEEGTLGDSVAGVFACQVVNVVQSIDTVKLESLLSWLATSVKRIASKLEQQLIEKDSLTSTINLTESHIASYAYEVASLKKDIEELRNVQDSTALYAAQTMLDAAVSRITTAEARIEAISTQLHELKNDIEGLTTNGKTGYVDVGSKCIREEVTASSGRAQVDDLASATVQCIENVGGDLTSVTSASAAAAAGTLSTVTEPLTSTNLKKSEGYLQPHFSFDQEVQDANRPLCVLTSDRGVLYSASHSTYSPITAVTLEPESILALQVAVTTVGEKTAAQASLLHRTTATLSTTADEVDKLKQQVAMLLPVEPDAHISTTEPLVMNQLRSSEFLGTVQSIVADALHDHARTAELVTVAASVEEQKGRIDSTLAELGKLGKYLENLAIRDIRSEAMQSKSCISAPGPVGWSHQGLRRLEIALSDIHIRLAVLEKPLCSTDDDPFRQGFLSLPGVEQKVIEAIKQTVTTADAATSEGDNKASHPVPPIPTKETDQVWKVGVDRRLVALDRALVTLNAGIQHSVPQHRLSSRTSGRRSSLSKSAILRAQATLNKREHEQARAEVGRLQDQMKRVLNNIAMITREVRENRATTSPRSSPGPTSVLTGRCMACGSKVSDAYVPDLPFQSHGSFQPYERSRMPEGVHGTSAAPMNATRIMSVSPERQENNARSSPRRRPRRGLTKSVPKRWYDGRAEAAAIDLPGLCNGPLLPPGGYRRTMHAKSSAKGQNTKRCAKTPPICQQEEERRLITRFGKSKLGSSERDEEGTEKTAKHV